MAYSEMNQPKKRAAKSFFGLELGIVLTMMLLAFIGITITDISQQSSRWYWLVIIPVLGSLCYVIEWIDIRSTGYRWTSLLLKHSLRWLGLLAAVLLVYILLHSGRLNNENAGLVILLLLAVTTFNAGIRQDWRLCVVGVFMGLGVLAVAFFEQYIWLALISAVLSVAVILFFMNRISKPKQE